MKKLDIFLIRSYIGPFVLTFFIALFFLVMQFLWKYVDDLVGKGLDAIVIAELLMYASASLVPLALPLAILLSSIMCFGNLGEKYELAAWKAAGVSLQRLMRPVGMITLTISLAAFYFSDNILPLANLKMQTLIFDVQQKRPALSIKEGAFYAGIDGYTIRIGKKEDNGSLRDILIYDHTQRMGNVKVVMADSGSMVLSSDERFLILTMYHGKSYEEMDKSARTRHGSHPFIRASFEEEMVRFDLSSFAFMRSDEDMFKDRQSMMNIRQLAIQKDTLIVEMADRRKDFSTNLLKSYFRRIDTPDSLAGNNAPRLPPVLKDTNILANFEKADRLKLLDVSLNLIRSAKAFTSITKDDLFVRHKNIIRHDVEIYRKITLSVACIVLFFIGAPLGAIIRKGGLGMPVVVSVGFFLLYYVTSITGEKFAREAVIDPLVGMWISTIILAPLGIFLTRKATMDSVLLNTEAYTAFFKKLLPGKKKRP